MGNLRSPLRLSLVFAALFVFPTGAQEIRNVGNIVSEDTYYGHAVDGSGSFAYSVSQTDQLGTNPSHAPEIFKWSLATGAGTQLTSYANGVESVSVSDDGQWIAFLSCSNPTGGNHDGSVELFVMQSDGTALAQLTSQPEGDLYGARISGSGNKIVFVEDEDPLGTNPSESYQLFMMDRDGSNLHQLTTFTAGLPLLSFSVSDDGTRLVFLYSTQVFAIEGDGTNLRQLTSPAQYGYSSPRISGNGATVVVGYSYEIQKMDWSGGGFVNLGQGFGASITNDGQSIVYSKDTKTGVDIARIASDGTGGVQLTSGAVAENYAPVVSGDGSAVVFLILGGQYPGGSNPDGGYELMAMDGSGGNLAQLTLQSGHSYSGLAEIALDGSRVFFVSGYDPLGTNPSGSYQLFRKEANGTGLVQLTSFTDRSVNEYALAANGQIYFGVDRDYSGCFELFRINANGSGLIQLTNFSCHAVSFAPQTFGTWVVFQSSGRVGTNLDGSYELFRIATNGTSVAPITADDDDSWKLPRVSETNPIWIVYQSRSNKDGQNPDGGLEIFRVQHTGANLQRLTADPLYESYDPDISSDGSKIVYASFADPLGTNPQHFSEIFLYDVPTATRRQLTFHSGSGRSRISKDGAWVYFVTGGEPYRVSVATGVIERVGGTRCAGADIDGTPLQPNGISVDRTGGHAVFSPWGNWDHSNPDGGTDIFLVDQLAPARIEVGKGAPTLVHWTHEPKPKIYDVIRGDVASLAQGGGNTVDLGAVVCLEDDSPDADTVGYEDALQPATGQVFFYLYRGSQGETPHFIDGPGSWGQGSGGKERIAGAGGCLP